MRCKAFSIDCYDLFILLTLLEIRDLLIAGFTSFLFFLVNMESGARSHFRVPIFLVLFIGGAPGDGGANMVSASFNYDLFILLTLLEIRDLLIAGFTSFLFFLVNME
jgi:hypothetical protein